MHVSRFISILATAINVIISNGVYCHISCHKASFSVLVSGVLCDPWRQNKSFLCIFAKDGCRSAKILWVFHLARWCICSSALCNFRVNRNPPSVLELTIKHYIWTNNDWIETAALQLLRVFFFMVLWCCQSSGDDYDRVLSTSGKRAFQGR